MLENLLSELSNFTDTALPPTTMPADSGDNIGFSIEIAVTTTLVVAALAGCALRVYWYGRTRDASSSNCCFWRRATPSHQGVHYSQINFEDVELVEEAAADEENTYHH